MTSEPPVRSGVMDEWSGVEAIAAAVGAATGIGGLVVASVANRRTKQANKFAKAANDLAAEALGKAREANDIAEHANKLSEEANSIAVHEAAKQRDPSHVEWRAKWDQETSIVTVTNHGRDVAVNTTVLVKRDEVEEVVTPNGRIARLESFVIVFPELPQQRQDHALIEDLAIRQARADRMFRPPTQFGISVAFDIRWFSEIGNPRQQTLKIFIS